MSCVLPSGVNNKACLCSLYFSQKSSDHEHEESIFWKGHASNNIFSNAVLSENLLSKEELEAVLPEGTEML